VPSIETRAPKIGVSSWRSITLPLREKAQDCPYKFELSPIKNKEVKKY
jgi:hypothetical protein